MTDLISRPAAIEAIRALPHLYGNKEQRARTGGYADAAMAVIGIPTIDPVKHGKWMEQKVTHEDNRRSTIIADWQSAKCSNCGKYHTTPYLYYFYHYDYCPSCGAKMDLEESEV